MTLRRQGFMMDVDGGLLGGAMAERTKETEGCSGAALIKFLDEAMQRGRVPPQTGANYIVACKAILPFVLGEDWTRADMTALDMGYVRHRLTATKGDRQMLRFDEHFLPAIDEFRKHLGFAPSAERIGVPADPQTDPERNGDVSKHRTDPARRRRVSTPTPAPNKTALDPVPGPSPRRRTNGDGKGRYSRTLQDPEASPPEKSPPLLDQSEVPIVKSSPVLPSFGVIPHLFPLRDGVLATLLLPADLTVPEARRLTAFIDSLALSDTPVHLPTQSDAPGYLPVTVADSTTNGSAASERS